VLYPHVFGGLLRACISDSLCNLLGPGDTVRNGHSVAQTLGSTEKDHPPFSRLRIFYDEDSHHALRPYHFGLRNQFGIYPFHDMCYIYCRVYNSMAWYRWRCGLYLWWYTARVPIIGVCSGVHATGDILGSLRAHTLASDINWCPRGAVIVLEPHTNRDIRSLHND
jgi:hypothetical protein